MGFLNKLFGKSKNLNQQLENGHSIDKPDIIDLSKVFPRIKGLYDDQNPEPFPENSNQLSVSFDDNPVIKPLAKGIGICYVVDKGDTYQIIQNRHLTEYLIGRIK